MPIVHHRYATVDGHRLFFREAGDPDAPAVILLHGFPTSSYMFRDLVPALADRYHVIAPDHLGFGLSDAPSVERVRLHVRCPDRVDSRACCERLKIDRYAIYVQDYGAPIGWRLALDDPAAITAIISQSGNAYDAGFVESFWKTVTAYQTEQTAETGGRGQAIPHLGRHPLAIRHRGAGRDAGQSGILVSRLCADIAAWQ